MDGLLQDVRYAVRRLRAFPAFTAVVVVTLGLGIGANAVFFSVIDAALFKTQPVADPDRLVNVVWLGKLTGNHTLLSYQEFVDIERSAPEFAAGFAASTNFQAPVTAGNEAEILPGELVSGAYFQTLGLRPVRGRFLDSSDVTRPGADTVAVISERLWRVRLGRSEGAVGATIRVNGQPLTIVGVAPAGFKGMFMPGIFQHDVWVPVTMFQEMLRSVEPRINRLWATFLTERTPLIRRLSVAARLKDGFTLEQASAAAEALGAALPAPERSDGVRTVLGIRPGAAGGSRFTREASRVMALAGLVLLVACANVAGLLLARGLARSHEIAVRLVSGGTRWRLVRQLMIESLVLALGAAIAAVALAAVLIALVPSLSPPRLEVYAVAITPELDLRVLRFTLVVALLTAVVVGLVPAMKASRPDVARALIGDAVVAGASRRWFSMRNGLVMTQFAVSTLLLLMAGEFVNSFVMISSFETGIPRTDRALIRLNLAANRYDREQGARFLASLMTRAREAGDLRAFTIASRLPAGSVTNDGVTILSAASDRELLRAAATAAIAPGLFETLGIPLRQGRDFNDYDTAGSPGVAIVSATAAQRFWPNCNPLGQRLSLLRGVWLEVVGVAADTRAHAIEGNEAFVYVPLTQRPSSQVVLIGASADGTAGAIVAMRRIVRDLDQDMAMGESTTVGDHLATFTYQYWIAAVVLGSLGGLALFLASLGIYGVLSYLVAEQTREVGVRMALGANAADVMRLILWQGMRVVGVGAAVGIYLASLAERVLASMWSSVAQGPPVSLVAAPMILCAVALLACYVPARRASWIDPLDALRHT